MPIGAQPPGRKGTVERPYSALNLRLILAAFGLVVCTVLAVLLFRADLRAPGWLLVVFAAIAAVDLVVVQLRRQARGRGHSLFE